MYRKGIQSSPAGTFEADAQSAKLPAVTWLMPPEIAGEHPDWRRRTFGDLTSALRLAQPPASKPIGFPGVDAEVTRADATDKLPKPVVPAAPQSEPAQEPGTKPHIGPH
ncbi:hypothetical protein [Nocardia iowensis]|uniref:Uncharacterized protein n=1 Tax=Nocardia iowensis TaxID=204891 RepID=A0ABX8RR80_NOCIO|nr:hypothetical protein [Nocardia iowensis]QXN90830.1 hypothetical protein KV110_36610 [Nocardia iowensis]